MRILSRVPWSYLILFLGVMMTIVVLKSFYEDYPPAGFEKWCHYPKTNSTVIFIVNKDVDIIDIKCPERVLEDK